MKKAKNKLVILSGIFIFLILVVSCVPETDSMGNAGQTLVKLNPPEYNKVLFAPVSTSQTSAALEVRRDPGGEAALNSTTTVVLKFDKDTAMIKEFNKKNDTYFSLLPSELYTSDPALASDGTVEVNFNPGEFVKSVMITVPNVFDFDFSKKYALAYKLVSVSGTGIKSLATSDTTIVEIAAQNAYEGWYHSVGFRDHPTAGVFPVDDDKYLATINQYTVETYTGDYMPYTLWITIDPDAPLANNVSVDSPNAVLYNNDPTVNARGIPGGYNHYDPVNKVYYLYYYYNSAAPRVIEEIITKK
jgi:BT_3987-like, N-terminal domain/BT_3044-like, C-terminal